MKKNSKSKKSPLKLKDIMQQVQWDEVAIELVGMHPELRPKLADYQEVLEWLKEMDPAPSEGQIVIEGDESCFDAWEQVDAVYQREGPYDEEGDTLSFTPWADCLGREVVILPFGSLSLQVVAAACLYEMTVYGFTEEDIREEERTLTKEIEEHVRKLKQQEQPDWKDLPEPSMKDTLRRLRKWLRWGSVAKTYFGESGSWFVERFIGDNAPERYAELDRRTLKSALIEIARDLRWVAREL